MLKTLRNASNVKLLRF